MLLVDVALNNLNNNFVLCFIDNLSEQL